MTDYDWPCDRREAHGPHEIDGADRRLPYGPRLPEGKECPGVKAHPATMIGRP